MRQKVMIAVFAAAWIGCGAGARAAEAGAEGKSYVLVHEDAEKPDALLREAAAFMEQNPVVYLATADGDSPRVRPVRYTFILDNKLVLATSAKKELSQQIEKNPRVEVSVTAADASAFLRYKGRAVLSKDAQIRERFLTAYPKFKTMYGDDLILYLVEPEKVGIFPMRGGTPKTKDFGTLQ